MRAGIVARVWLTLAVAKLALLPWGDTSFTTRICERTSTDSDLTAFQYSPTLSETGIADDGRPQLRSA